MFEKFIKTKKTAKIGDLFTDEEARHHGGIEIEAISFPEGKGTLLLYKANNSGEIIGSRLMVHKTIRKKDSYICKHAEM